MRQSVGQYPWSDAISPHGETYRCDELECDECDDDEFHKEVTSSDFIVLSSLNLIEIKACLCIYVPFHASGVTYSG